MVFIPLSIARRDPNRTFNAVWSPQPAGSQVNGVQAASGSQYAGSASRIRGFSALTRRAMLKRTRATDARRYAGKRRRRDERASGIRYGR